MVEDDAPVRRLIVRLLEKHGFQVLAAADAGAAHALARTTPGPIDLLLSDVHMPGVGGEEFAVQFATLRPGVPVAYMTGAEWAGGASGPRMLPKPFTTQGLLDHVRAALASDHAE